MRMEAIIIIKLVILFMLMSYLEHVSELLFGKIFGIILSIVFPSDSMVSMIVLDPCAFAKVVTKVKAISIFFILSSYLISFSY